MGASRINRDGATAGSPLRMLLVLSLVGVFGTAAEAQDLTGFVELFWSHNDTETERVNGPTTLFESSTLRQRYRVDFAWQLYPNLHLSLGGLFEQDDVTNQGIVLGDTTVRRLRPYIALRQNSRLFFANLNIDRLQDRFDALGQSAQETQDNYSAWFGWRPEPYPTLSVRLERTDNYDASRRLLDVSRDLAEFRIQYLAADRVIINYRTGQDNSENKIEGNEVQRNYHTGNISYGDQYWNRRLQFSAEYEFSIQDSEISTSGSGEIGLPLRADEGLSELTDFAENVVLLPNPELIDENFIASAGLNLGLIPPGGDARPRNIGLDLGEPTTLNNLRVWVDRELPLIISNSFVWEIYTSDDNNEWLFRQTVVPGAFGTFETRFDLRFGALTTRYIKCVVRPLDPAVPGSDQFPLILVTELQALLFTPASDIETQIGNSIQRVTTDLRARLLNSKNFFYEFSYTARDADDRPVAWSMSNGFSYNERFSPTYALSARVARVDEQDAGREATSLIYSASLRATAIPTLTQTLVFSGRREEIDLGTDYTNQIFLYNGLQIYRGLTTNIGLGSTVSKRPSGERISNQQVNATANLTPHRALSMNLQYQLLKEKRQGGEIPEERDTDRGIGSVSLAYTPLPTIYLFGSYRVEFRSNGEDLTTRNYSMSWAPLPGGNLQLSFRYNETFRDELHSLFRFFTTRARWNITSRWFVEIAWEDARNKTDLGENRTETLRTGTRLVF